MLNFLHKVEDTRDETDTGLAARIRFREDTDETGDINQPVDTRPPPPTDPLRAGDLQLVIPPEYPDRGVDFITVDNSTGVTIYGEMKSRWSALAPAMQNLAGSLEMRALTYPKIHGTTDYDRYAHHVMLITGELTEADPLEGYEVYAVEDWDGYDARPITPDTLRAARSILKSLPKTFGDPVCSPGADGSIVFEWLKDDGPLCKLFIDIGPGRTWKAYWRLASGRTGTIARKRVTISTIPELQKLFETLLRG
ncbi:MAG: hypothetical protein ACRED5_17275 [Propylenella sp.]